MGKMSLRSALASVLQRLRRERGMSQADFVGTVTQSHISLLEAGETSVSTDTLDAMCSSLGMHPVAFMTLVYSAYEQLTPAEVLERAQANITELGLLEQRFEAAPEDHPHPRVSSAAKARRAVHELKKSGHSQAEIAGLLQMAESTVRRHWHRKDA
ncbi:helix-turn-helix domain-containing protein [Pseudomonas syringae group sp. 247E2]|uniref:helix-turn-helix domain-containing protein n=1 Tax=Pseudomonas syringae group sp. 247E2 TaxID=3079592 RepID=UPI00290685AC|nr:helix-turn-helix domain-containing protein [Pseudomonas syringae group sp. 247E2]MDU8605033.1 helix-turn-helix domain-containing protein [Pseudomonas syringae group sp. 247E2]